MRCLSPLLVLLAVGCGDADPAAACEDYVDASNTCIGESGGADSLDASFCLAYNGLTGADAQETEDALDCATGKIEALDCTGDVSAELAGILDTCGV